MGLTERGNPVSLKPLLLVTTHRCDGTVALWTESCSRRQWQAVGKKKTFKKKKKSVGLRGVSVWTDQHHVLCRKGSLL